MTKEKQYAVKKWLRKISRIEQAIINIQRTIADLEYKLQHPPSYLVTGIGGYGRGGHDGEASTKAESYAAWHNDTLARIERLQNTLSDRQKIVDKYKEAIDGLGRELGDRHVRIIEAKFYRHLRPDWLIYKEIVFCSKRTFYRELYQALEFFADVLPEEFLDKKKAAG